MTYPNSVAVIISCFNQANFLAAAIESVLAQEHENLEVVVVNDGFTNRYGFEFTKCASSLRYGVDGPKPKSSVLLSASANAVSKSFGVIGLPSRTDWFVATSRCTNVVGDR